MVNELKPGTTDKLTPEQWAQVDAQRAKEQAAKTAKKPDVRVLSASEMEKWKGSGPYRNKYCAGTLPWHRSLRDVNLCNGNLFKSFTDVQVSPGRGAGLALQRTYNSQDDRPGAFGTGWTHAYDLRMEEENPSTNETSDSLNVADRTDFFGGKHKYHRDADGLYSPPAYLFDETQSSYQQFLVSGPVVPLDDTETGMDGTVKHFVKVSDNWRACDYIQDRYGSRTTLVYGASVNGASVPILLSTVTDPVGRQLVFTWNNLGTTAQPIYRIVQVDSPQYSVAYSYNADANLSSVTLDPGMVGTGHLNRTTSYGYTSVTGQNGTETGLLNSVTDALGHTMSYSYSIPANGNYTGTAWVTGASEPSSNNGVASTLTWTFTPNSTYGSYPFNCIAANNAGLSVMTVSDSQLRKHGLQLSGVYMYLSWFDSANNITQQTNTGGNLSLFANLYANSGSTDMFCTYGPHGNVLTSSYSSDPNAPHNTISYYNGSQFFQKKSMTDMNGHTSTFGIGSKYAGTAGDPDTNAGDRGNVLWVKDAKYGDGTLNNTGTRFSYSYNGYGQKVQEVNQNGVVVNYSYGDAYGNLTQAVQNPGTGHLSRATSVTYDVAGHVLTSTDPLGQQSTFNYNVLGQPTSTFFPATYNAQNVLQTAAETVSYSYGGNGRTESISDNRGTTSLSYESSCDRVHSTADPVTGTTTYAYGLAGERLSMDLPGGGRWTYGYDRSPVIGCLSKDDPNSLSHNLATLTDDQGRRVDVYLDQSGRCWETLTNEAFSGTNLVSYTDMLYTFDSLHLWLTQLQNVYHYQSAQNQWQSKLLVQNNYTLDNAGQRLTNQISSLDPTTGNLTSRTELYSYDALNRVTSVDYGDGQTQGYTFDQMGNRMTKTDSVNGSESYTVNADNMLTSRTVGGTTSSYTNDTDGNMLTGSGRTNTWDSRNRMTKCVNGTNTSTFIYGSDGIRHSSVVNTVSTDFVLDNNMFVRELHSGNVKATYFMGASGPAYRRDDANGGTVRWYLYDGLGSVLGEVDPNGNITARRKYDVYGATRTGSDAGTSKHKFVGRLGHPSEDETSLIYMQARYYDPQIGRFVSEDPKGDGSNWFVYSASNPVNFSDATGKSITNDDWFNLLGNVLSIRTE